MKGIMGAPQEFGRPPYCPIWQALLAISDSPPNMYDQLSEPKRASAILQALNSPTVVFSELIDRRGSSYYETYGGLPSDIGLNVYYPIFDASTNEAVGVAVIEVIMSEFITNVLSANSDLVDIIIQNSCGQALSLRASETGIKLSVKPKGILSDSRDDEMARSIVFGDFKDSVVSSTTGLHAKSQQELDNCRYSFSIYPTLELEDEYVTKPLLYAFITGVIFVFTTSSCTTCSSVAGKQM